MRKKGFAFIILGLLVILVAFVPTVRFWVLNNTGRWHVVLLHFPIGLLVLGWLFEVGSRLGIKDITRTVIGYVLGLGATAALLAAASGLVLHEQGGYDPDLVEWHERLGIATVLLAFLSFWLQKSTYQKLYLLVLTLTVVLLTIAGHYGGSLTHGEDFLTEDLMNWEDPALEALQVAGFEEAVVWDDVIEPIFAAKCQTCHNPSKKKGELLLMDSASVLAGGENGTILEMNKPTGIHTVLNLPEEDDLHMPPKGKLQLTQEEVDIICWWVESNTPFNQKVAAVDLKPEIKSLLEQRLAPPDPIDLLGIEMIGVEQWQELLNEGYRIVQPDPKRPWLAVNLSDFPNLKEGNLEELDYLQANITHLDLGNTVLNAGMLEWVVNCEQLKELKLDQCTMKGEDLLEIADLQHLQFLNLYGAQISGDVVGILGQMEQLDRMYLWNSSLSQADLEVLKRDLPSVQIIAESPLINFPVQKIMPPYFDMKTPFLDSGTALPLASKYPNVEIRYTTDGSEPGKESALLTATTVFDHTCKVKARSYLEGWDPSIVVEQTLVKKWQGTFSIVNHTAGNEKYNGLDGKGLADGKIGALAITDKQWLGRWGKDFKTTIDLGSVQSISGIALHALEDIKSWVFFPSEIKVAGGGKLNQMKALETVHFDKTTQEQGARGETFQVAVQAPVRFLEITVKSFGNLPDWHESAGQPSWLFLDEVAVY